MGEDTGETNQSYLEKITPKDLVMFSSSVRKIIAKNDFNYLDVDYDLQLPDQKQQDSIRVWGLPQARLQDPVPLGVLLGFSGASIFNFFRRRPALTSIHLHLLSSLAIAGIAKLGYAKFEDYRTQRELVIWDYVKKHPKDFPEVFNPPKKYKDLLLSWRPVR